MNKKFGFTLAEVLITLGIIGVVAAMTIPTLIANTNSAKFRSQFKKTLSTLNQAGLMAQAQYDIDYGATTQTCAAAAEGTGAKAINEQNPDTNLTFCAILNGTLAGGGNVTFPYTSAVTLYSSNMPAITSASNADAGNYVYYGLADGSLVGINKNAKGCALPIGTPLTSAQLKAGVAANESTGTAAVPAGGLNNCIGFIDVNGKTLPNKEVSCGTGATAGTGEGEGTNVTKLAPETPCTVGADANHMTDIYPVVFHDATVEPASNAAKYVLTTSK